jgi:hypothetical protein
MTTPEEHNKYLAYSHLGYGAFQLLMGLLMTGFFMLLLSNDLHGGPPAAFVAFMVIFILIFQLLFTLPSFIAGFALLKKKEWAKTATIIAGVMAAMSFPIGTAVCVYTFWFLLGESGKNLYDRKLAETGSRSDYFLNEQRDTNFASGVRERKQEYVPPKEMPDWRG